ncbi:MAG: hypothetical protein NVSMB9_23580 [Isosphaeraceae bacterium]
MPSRLVCVAILFYWLVASVGLVSRDLLPELNIGAPPDLRTIAAAGLDSPPAHWNIQVVDPTRVPPSLRVVGLAVTESRRGADGGVELSSKVTLDSGRLLSGLLKGASYAGAGNDQISFLSTYRVDPSGNLRSFHSEVRMINQPEDLWRIDGRRKGSVMEIVSDGPLPVLNRTLSFPYQPHGVVQSQFGPLDRLPGLYVGQRWDEQMASPLSGQVETVRAEVKHGDVIYWDKSPVPTLEVLHTSKAMTARTWVRQDGLVLRQEVVLPMLRLVLERTPDVVKIPPAPPR